jgi:tRNA threonylcarbamoyladenosine biosynthesis protein TsaE
MKLEFEHIGLNGLPQIAQKIIPLFDTFPCLAISGDMGSGKTTFTRILLESMAISTFEGSPTFSIIEPYLFQNKIKIYHIDAFRIANQQEAFLLGLDELFEEKAYFVVEWPEKISNFLPVRSMYLELCNDLKGNRNYTLYYGNES